VYQKLGFLAPTVNQNAVRSDSGARDFWGVGLRYRIGHIALRAEYESFVVENIKEGASMVTIGALYQF